jgi:hypothetical protein
MKEMEQISIMKISSLSKYALGTVAAAGILAGCSSGAQTGGLGASGVTPAARQGLAQTVVAHNGVIHAISGGQHVISPDKNKKSKGGYAYVSDSGSYELYVYKFSQGQFGSEVGSTTSEMNEPQGLCANKSTVYLANTGASQILMYKAPSLNSSGSLTTSGEYPAGCAVDKKGDVAVSDICNSTSCGPGNVDIFKGGKGTPTSVTCPNLSRYYFIAYDSKSNVFVDGEDASGAFGFCEIPAGKSSGEAITLNQNPEFPGGVQASGKYITILDQDANAIDQYTISGTSGTLAGTVSLGGGISDPVTDWITKNGKTVLTANAGSANATSFKYPAGGSPTSTVSGLSEPIGVTVAK